MAALELECQLGVVDAQAAKDGRLQIVHVDGIFGDVVAVIVGFAERHAGLDAAAGHPHGEAAAVVVAAIIGGGETALAIDGAAEFAAPDDQRVVQHAALFQVGDQRGGGLVHIFAALGQFDRADSP